MSVASLSNTRITVQRGTDVANASGYLVRTWATHLTLSARVQPVSSQYNMSGHKENYRVTHRVYVAGTPDIKGSDRITFSGITAGSYLYVQAVRNIDIVGDFLTLDCEEIDGGD